MVSSKEQFQEMRQMDELEQRPIKPIAKPKEQGLTLTTNSLLSMDAATIDTIARAIVQEVSDGNKDSLETLILAKKGAALFKAIDDNVKNYAYAQPYASKGENVVRFNCKIEQAELGVKYDYASTKDDEWLIINAQFEALKKKKEDREKYLKTIKGKVTLYDEDTAEVKTVYEAVKSGQVGFKITIQ